MQCKFKAHAYKDYNHRPAGFKGVLLLRGGEGYGREGEWRGGEGREKVGRGSEEGEGMGGKGVGRASHSAYPHFI